MARHWGWDVAGGVFVGSVAWIAYRVFRPLPAGSSVVPPPANTVGIMTPTGVAYFPTPAGQPAGTRGNAPVSQLCGTLYQSLGPSVFGIRGYTGWVKWRRVARSAAWQRIGSVYAQPGSVARGVVRGGGHCG